MQLRNCDKMKKPYATVSLRHSVTVKAFAYDAV